MGEEEEGHVGSVQHSTSSERIRSRGMLGKKVAFEMWKR